jgi:CubicO group peptidase (beta-lactamase class C family)
VNLKRFLFGSVVVGAALPLTRKLFATTGPAKPASNRASYEAIDAYVEGQMRRLKIPGAALAIIEGGKIVHLRGFGRARPGGEAPTPQTPFFIGSLTKSFTALAVMQLVEAGKVELDAPVQRYLPWFRVADAQASARMTVRHLLNQTSGLPTLPGELVLADFDDRPDATERQVRALVTLKITRPVGSKCEYSNLNYNVLGLIVEAASGESYAEYVQTHILDPLDMRHSYTSKAAAKQDGLAIGHRHWFNLPLPGAQSARPAEVASLRPAHLERRRHGALPDRPSQRRALWRRAGLLGLWHRRAAPWGGGICRGGRLGGTVRDGMVRDRRGRDQDLFARRQRPRLFGLYGARSRAKGRRSRAL